MQERLLNLRVLLVPNVRLHNSSHNNSRSHSNGHRHNSNPNKGHKHSSRHSNRVAEGEVVQDHRVAIKVDRADLRKEEEAGLQGDHHHKDVAWLLSNILVDNRSSSSKGEVQGLSNNNRLQEELHHLSAVLVPDPCMHQLPSCTKQHRLPSNPGSPCNLCLLSHLLARLLISLCTKQWLSSNHPLLRRQLFRLHLLPAKH